MTTLRRHTALLGLVAFVAVSFIALPSFGQAVTGNVFGTVESANGELLPGVLVTLNSSPAKNQQTNQQGQFRFLGIDPGTYSMSASLEGSGSVEYPEVNVNIGRNTTINLRLSPSVDEVLTVTSESPLLDERKLSQGAQITQTELEKIPTARDPWAILNQTPGVLVDRVNVGGNESGQQAAFRAQGVGGGQNDFLVDGVSITDMRATGASPTYYDFDQFAEMQFTTGGTDVTKNTAGVSVNLVTKRGSNEFRGSARFYNTKAGGYFGGKASQSQPGVSASDLGSGSSTLQCLSGDTNPGCTETYAGAQIREIEDMGFEAGGAAVRDRLWMWGSWGQNDVQQNAASGTADDTILENQSLKLNGQVTTENSAVASWNNGDKQKFGRGASTTRPDITTWNQRGPSAVYRFEDTHVFSSNLFVTGTYSLGDFGFALAAKGGTGPNAPRSVQRADGIWQDNYLSGAADGPNDEFKVDGSYFFNTADVSHELKVGGRVRTYESYSAFAWPGGNVFTDHDQTSGGGIESYVGAKRGVATPTTMEYFSLWAQDTVSFGNFTLNIGLRYDDQSGVNEAFTVAANPIFPDVLPAINYPGGGNDFDWTSITPRIGATYALGKNRDTLLRASFAQFADQLAVGNVTRTNPAGEAYAYFSFDGDGVNSWTNEVLTPEPGLANGFDPSNPTSLSDPDVNDSSLDAPLTSELILSVEHALLPEFVVGLTLTARNVTDILEERTLVRDASGNVRTITRNDYVADGFVSGTISNPNAGGSSLGYNVPVFARSSSVTTTGGDFLTNGSRERNYRGAAVNFTKRLANRWMMRGYLNYGDAEWDIDDNYLFNSNPNRESGVGADIGDSAGSDIDGGLYVTRSTGSGKGERFLQSTWTANLNGMYQVAPDRPWGFNVSASAQAREGYPTPYYDSVVTSDGVSRTINVGQDFDGFRLDDLATFDLRAEKEFALSSAVNFTFGIDVFNVTNEGTELSRIRNLSSSRAYFLNDNVSPRIYRLGVRLGWK